MRKTWGSIGAEDCGHNWECVDSTAGSGQQLMQQWLRQCAREQMHGEPHGLDGVCRPLRV